MDLLTLLVVVLLVLWLTGHFVFAVGNAVHVLLVIVLVLVVLRLLKGKSVL